MTDEELDDLRNRLACVRGNECDYDNTCDNHKILANVIAALREERALADELVEMLAKAADTFKDFVKVLSLLGHKTTSQAATIAEEATRTALAKHAARRGR